MSWLHNNNISKKAINIGIFHEGINDVNFDYYINIDTTFNSNGKYISIPRPLFNFLYQKMKISVKYQ